MVCSLLNLRNVLISLLQSDTLQTKIQLICIIDLYLRVNVNCLTLLLCDFLINNQIRILCVSLSLLRDGFFNVGFYSDIFLIIVSSFRDVDVVLRL